MIARDDICFEGPKTHSSPENLEPFAFHFTGDEQFGGFAGTKSLSNQLDGFASVDPQNVFNWAALSPAFTAFWNSTPSLPF